MGAPLGIGKAFGEVVRGERDQRDFYGAAEAAAKHFESLGSDNARQLAQMMRSDPRGTFAMAEQFGGVKELFALEQANAAKQRIATATAGQQPGSREFFGAAAGAAVHEGQLAEGAQLGQLGFTAPRDADTSVQEIGTKDGRLVRALVSNATGDIVKILGEPYRQYAPPSSQPGWGFSYSVDANGNPIVDVSQGVPGASVGQLRDLGSARGSLDIVLNDVTKLRSLISKAPAIASGFGRGGKIATGIAGGLESRGVVESGTSRKVADLAVPGAKPTDYGAYNTAANSLVTNARKLLQSDTAANMTELEQARLREITSVLDWTTSPEMTLSVIKEVALISIRAEVMKSVQIGAASPYDPTTEEGIDRAEASLRKAGFEDEEILSVLSDIQDQVSAQRSTGPLVRPPTARKGGGNSFRYSERGQPPE